VPGESLLILFFDCNAQAVTTSEKLEMTGEPVNISNIEKKKVREEFENVSDKFKMIMINFGNQIKTGAEK
jgi:hypothetical protein